MDGCMEAPMDRCVDGCMDVWKEGWRHGGILTRVHAGMFAKDSPLLWHTSWNQVIHTTAATHDDGHTLRRPRTATATHYDGHALRRPRTWSMGTFCWRKVGTLWARGGGGGGHNTVPCTLCTWKSSRTRPAASGEASIAGIRSRRVNVVKAAPLAA